MKTLSIGVVVFLACCLSAAAQDAKKAPAPPPGPLQLTLELVDKVLVIGAPVGSQAIEFKFAFGAQTVSYDLLTSVDLRKGPADAKVRFANGDVLSGEPLFAELKVNTPFGQMTIPRGDILTLSTGRKTASFSHGPQEGLVLHLPLEEDAKDHSELEIHGTPTGTLKFVDTPSGKAASFDGASQWITMPNAKSLQLIGDQTIAFWIKPTTFASSPCPIHKAWGGEGSININGSGHVNYYFGVTGSDSGNYATLTTSKPIVAGRWVHLCVVRNFKTQKLQWFFDGKLDTEIPSSIPNAAAGASPWKIANGYSGQPYAGLMKDVRMYRRALSAEEVAEIVGIHKALLGG